jgi:hypothetical protein
VPTPRSKSGSKSEIIFNAEPAPLDFSAYLDSPRIAAQYAKPTWAALENAKPSDVSAAAREQLERIGAVAVEIDRVLNERESVAGVKPWFVDFGNAWGALHDTLNAIGIDTKRDVRSIGRSQRYHLSVGEGLSECVCSRPQRGGTHRGGSPERVDEVGLSHAEATR